MSSEKDLEKIHVSVKYLKQALADPALQGITYDDFVRAVYLCAEGDKSIFGEIQSSGSSLLSEYAQFKMKVGQSGAGGNATSTPPSKKKKSRRSSIARLKSALGMSGEKKTKSASKGTVREADGSIGAIQQALQTGKNISLHFPIRLLDQSIERIMVTPGTTVHEVCLGMDSILNISSSAADKWLGLFLYTRGQFRRLKNDQKILEIAATWTNQEHVDDTAASIIYKRIAYEPGDELEREAARSQDESNAAHRIAYVDAVYHVTRGLYSLTDAQAIAFAASILYCKSGGNANIRQPKQFRKAVKKYMSEILPPHMQRMEKNQLRQAAGMIQKEYAKFTKLSVFEMQRAVNRNIKSWVHCYGGNFFAVKYKKSCNIEDPALHFRLAILGVCYKGIVVREFSSSGVVIEDVKISWDEIDGHNCHELEMAAGAVTLISVDASEHEDGGVFVESSSWEDIKASLDTFSSLNGGADAEDAEGYDAAAADIHVHKRRPSVAEATNNILANMGNEFTGWEFDNATATKTDDVDDIDDDDDDDAETGSLWDAHVDNASGRKYYVNRHSRRSSWVLPEGGLDSVAAIASASASNEDAGSAAAQQSGRWSKATDQQGRTYYYEKKGKRRTSWVLPEGGIVIDDSGLPEGWQELTDANGTTYYYNSSTGESSWQRPS